MEDKKEWKTEEKSDIEIRDLSVTFQDGGEMIHAMEDVSAYFPSGSVTGLIGESGSGKSLLGMSILGLLSGQARVEGSCMYKGMDLYRLPEKEMQKIRGKEIALIPQNPTESLNPIRRIGKQLTECMTVHGNKDKELADSRRDEFLRRFGFSDPDRINRAYSFQLSGGMNQRVISAMGLMNRPKWVIADEPTKGLDAILRRQVYRVLKEISETDTEGMIVITHDIALAGALCDRLMVLYKGSIMEAGETKTILEHPAHPYTKGLIASLPGQGMNPIGRAVRKKEGNSGCSFYPRCAHAVDACKNGRIPEAELPDGRKVRCVRYA